MKQPSLIILVLSSILFLSLSAALAPAVSQASPPALPTRAEDVRRRGGSGGGDDGGTAGATIELHIQGVPNGVWAAVQWQDSAGEWHDVEGWRGALDAGGVKSWWIHPKDFSTGPFRWVVSQAPGEHALATSAAFNLPSMANQVLRIEVTGQ
jgi:hypothetical protein